MATWGDGGGECLQWGTENFLDWNDCYMLHKCQNSLNYTLKMCAYILHINCASIKLIFLKEANMIKPKKSEKKNETLFLKCTWYYLVMTKLPK